MLLKTSYGSDFFCNFFMHCEKKFSFFDLTKILLNSLPLFWLWEIVSHHSLFTFPPSTVSKLFSISVYNHSFYRLKISVLTKAISCAFCAYFCCVENGNFFNSSEHHKWHLFPLFSIFFFFIYTFSCHFSCQRWVLKIIVHS